MRQVGYRPNTFTADTGRNPTKAIWDNIPWSSIEDGEREGWVMWDDFINVPALAVNTYTGQYGFYGDTGNTFLQTATSEFGELAILTDGTGADDDAIMTTGGNTGGLASFELQATRVPHTIAFEARLKKSSITTGSIFVGFGEEGLAASNGLMEAAANLMTDVDYLGFHMAGANADMDVLYNKAGGGADPSTLITTADTLVANTYVKWGLIYNYKNRRDRQIKFYIDGVLQSTYFTKALIDDTTNFPGGEEMALYAGLKNTSAATNTLTLDWWKAAQVING